MSNVFDFNDASLLSSIVLLSFKGSVIITLILVIQRLARPWLSAQAIYWLWMPALFCLFIPFGVATTWSPFTSITAPLPEVGSATAIPTTTPSIQPLPEPTVNPLFLVWLACAFVLFSIVLYNVIRFIRIQARAKSVSDSIHPSLSRCKLELHIRRNVRVLESSEISIPSVYGWLKPTIVLPEGLAAELNPDELKFVLMHELAHVKRHDIALNWLVTMVQILHWFNPIVWYGFHRMRRDHEIACDARVLRQLPHRLHGAYGHTLISLMERYPRAHQFSQGLGIVGNTKRMKERLHMIKQYKTFRKWHIVVGAASLLVVALLAFSENRVGAHDVPAHQTDADSNSIQTKLHQIRVRLEHMDLDTLHDHIRKVHKHGTTEMKDQMHHSLDILHEHGTNDEKDHALRHLKDLDEVEREERESREDAKREHVEIEELKNNSALLRARSSAPGLPEKVRVEMEQERAEVLHELVTAKSKRKVALHDQPKTLYEKTVRLHQGDVKAIEKPYVEKKRMSKAETEQADMRTKLELQMRELKIEQDRLLALQAKLQDQANVLEEKAARIADMKEKMSQEQEHQ